jgi:predicted PurR-regulated permease PerM
MVWLPFSIYLWQGLILIGYGVLVIGLVDNVVRPLLVGSDTKTPDYVVLLSTLGGLTIFGFNGFLIGPLTAAMFIAVWQLFGSARSGRPIESSRNDSFSRAYAIRPQTRLDASSARRLLS